MRKPCSPYLPMNEYLAALVHGSRNPHDDVLKVLPNILSRRIIQWKDLVGKLLGKHRLHAAHSLNDVCDAAVLQVVQTLRRLDVADVELRDHHCHVL